jgi:hypothetical protein
MLDLVLEAKFQNSEGRIQESAEYGYEFVSNADRNIPYMAKPKEKTSPTYLAKESRNETKNTFFPVIFQSIRIGIQI